MTFETLRARMSHGWNTFSVLFHVPLPEGLGLRWTGGASEGRTEGTE